MKIRKIRLHQGQSPGDILVLTRAIYDLATQYPDYEIVTDTPCNAIFENNPLVNKSNAKIPEVSPNADNLVKLGYDVHKIAWDYTGLFKDMVRKNELTAQKKGRKYEYCKDGVAVFTSKLSAKINRYEEYDVDYDGEDYGIRFSGPSGNHFSTAFYESLERKLGVKIKQTSLYPKLYLSEDEKSWTNQVEDEYGYKGKFWLINSGYKADCLLKDWGFENWQSVVNLLSDRIQFVQVGELSTDHTHGALENVIDLRGKTDLRQLIRLSYHAEGACSHVSLLMHLMAAWKKPCVVVAGGREEFRWEQYQNQRYVNVLGQLSCAKYGGCWKSGRIETKKGKEENKKCINMTGNKPRCMSMIKPDQVAKEVMNYYYGGALQF